MARSLIDIVCPFEEACSHSKAYRYYADSIIGGDLVAYPCSSYEKFIEGSCDQTSEIPMGHFTPNTTRGNHFAGALNGPGGTFTGFFMSIIQVLMAIVSAIIGAINAVIEFLFY